MHIILTCWNEVGEPNRIGWAQRRGEQLPEARTSRLKTEILDERQRKRISTEAAMATARGEAAPEKPRPLVSDRSFLGG